MEEENNMQKKVIWDSFHSSRDAYKMHLGKRKAAGSNQGRLEAISQSVH